jgi:hypothetical protein
MTNRPRPLVGNGTFECATAAASSASTSEWASVAADSSLRNRTCFPDPTSSRFGSGSFAPQNRQIATRFARAAMERIPSDGRSVGE